MWKYKLKKGVENEVNEFKLNYYFNIYKNLPLPNRDEFRKNFKKKHGKFQYLEELIVKIEQYQFKKYGMTLPKGDILWMKNKEERERESRKSYTRLRNRLGK